MSDQNMKHKKKILSFVLIVVLMASAYMFLPHVVKKILVSQAANKGWNVTMGKIDVKWMKILLKDVVAVNDDGTKQGKFDQVQVEMDGKLKPRTLSIKGGSIHMTGPFKKVEGNGGKRIPVKMMDVDVNWKMSDETEMNVEKASVEMSDETTKVSAVNVEAKSKHGHVGLEGVTAIKTMDSLSGKAEKVSMSFKDMVATLTDVAVGKLVMKSEHVEVEARVREASFPHDVSSSGMAVKLTMDLTTEMRTHFAVTADSVSGQHKSVSKNVVATDRVSAEGDFEVKTFSTDEIVHEWSLETVVKSGKVSVGIEVKRQKTDGRPNLLAFAFTLRDTPCQSVLEAIPEAMRTELDGVVFDGNMEGTIVVNTLEEKDNDPFIYVRLDQKCKVKTVPKRISDALNGRPFKRFIYTSSGELKEVTSGTGGTPFPSISPYMAKAVVTTEDPGFWGHHGFDIEAIRNSLRENVKNRKFTRGASTIPMQLAKNMFLSRDKTATRKLQEFFLTMIIDQKMTKDKILEAYLNIVEFGPNLYGIGPASRHYFDTNPSQLSLGQSIFLSSILPRPRATYFNTDGALNDGKKNQIALILDLMVRRNSITEEEARLAKEESIVFGSDKSDQSHHLDTSDWETQ